MITEDYVSFEVAKLLKERGFDERLCNTCYMYNGQFCNNRKSLSGINTMISCQAPTLQMAMKWLREVHDIHIKINIDSFDGRIPVYEALYDEIINIRTDNFIDYGNTYEEACEAAIKYCLTNLI